MPYRTLSQKQFDRKMIKHQEAVYPVSYTGDPAIANANTLATFTEIRFDAPRFEQANHKIVFRDCFFDLARFNNLYRTFGPLYFTDCTFIDCRMRPEMIFNNTVFDRCSFYSCEFDDANMAFASFADCMFYNSYIRGSNWYDARIDGTRFRFNSTRIDYNLFILGHDLRNYTYWMAANPDNVVTIFAGCQKHVGLDAAHNHWDYRSYYQDHVKPSILSYLDLAEKIARSLCWKLNPDPRPEDLEPELDETETLIEEDRQDDDDDLELDFSSFDDDDGIEFLPLDTDEEGNLI